MTTGTVTLEKPKNYRELLLRKQNGFEVDDVELRLWRMEEELILAALCGTENYRDCLVKPSHMAAEMHAVAWRAIQSICEKQPHLKDISVGTLLSEMCCIDEELGGPKAANWIEMVAHSFPVDHAYGRQEVVAYILKNWRLRQARRRFGMLTDRIGKDADLTGLQKELVGAARELVYEIEGEGVMEKPIDEIEWDPEKKDLTSLVPTGNAAIDRCAGGGHGRGELLIIGGGTSVGKSFCAQRILRDQARLGHGVLYISAEDPRELMHCRMISDFTEPGVAPKDVRQKRQPEVVREALVRMKDELKGRVHVLERKKAKISVVCDLIRNYRYTHNIDTVVIDYLQAITEDEPMNNRVQETSNCVSKLKRCFTDCSVAGIVFSQYSREAYKDNTEPSITACKYAGDIENEAEIMALMWRDTDGVIHVKLPKVKWSRAENLRFVIPVNEVTGCHRPWQEDFAEAES